MFLTNVLFKKAKSKMIMVLMESVVSGHQVTMIRERLADKLEFIRFDPYTIVKVGNNNEVGCRDAGDKIFSSTRELVQGKKED